MATFVLVHGSWIGGWCYSKTARIMRAGGHDVFAPTLTGLGERTHLLNGGIDLGLHIKDVTNVFAYERLSDVILVGHSYGGMVVTGVSSVCADQIKSLVYLDAFLPDNGQSHWDISGERAHSLFLDGQRDMPGRIVSMDFIRQGADPDRPRSIRALDRQPLLTLLEPVKLDGAEQKIKRRRYILATGGAGAGFRRFYDKVKDTPGWSVDTIATGHLAMLEDPEGLAKMLLEEASH
jgi:pimeloyl-ACP methyl ester carboxylesterase